MSVSVDPGVNQNQVDAIHGVMAEFDTPEGVTHAAHEARLAGYSRMDAYTPFPVEGLSDELDFPRSAIPWLVSIGALTGALLGYTLALWVSASAYPIVIGGRPLNSILSFVPITFEMTILFGAFTAVISILILNGLPQPYHPVFNIPAFSRATTDRFFLCIESSDLKFEPAETRRFLERMGAQEVYDVPE